MLGGGGGGWVVGGGGGGQGPGSRQAVLAELNATCRHCVSIELLAKSNGMVATLKGCFGHLFFFVFIAFRLPLNQSWTKI